MGWGVIFGLLVGELVVLCASGAVDDEAGACLLNCWRVGLPARLSCFLVLLVCLHICLLFAYLLLCLLAWFAFV